MLARRGPAPDLASRGTAASGVEEDLRDLALGLLGLAWAAPALQPQPFRRTHVRVHAVSSSSAPTATDSFHQAPRRRRARQEPRPTRTALSTPHAPHDARCAALGKVEGRVPRRGSRSTHTLSNTHTRFLRPRNAPQRNAFVASYPKLTPCPPDAGPEPRCHAITAADEARAGAPPARWPTWANFPETGETAKEKKKKKKKKKEKKKGASGGMGRARALGCDRGFEWRRLGGPDCGRDEGIMDGGEIERERDRGGWSRTLACVPAGRLQHLLHVMCTACCTGTDLPV
ncbi:uncharacterized protein K452DRAFT_136953 [Aplosporella prunicola CBS 121167]|uniref:Uncharacterized protein n=1 Tax=Aplosporella prunicola CBS 121167 TaxID=1176127 RepID=A0A6A6BRM9_9PEZI|nr:uncharacterized protein K452DRAFT_136953 [Aplosporella prunicola CBS 121167]KAF2145241.1 hypothetical protein K452DRAFT_136953 [Aplosporella prunicola CBS 121167]